MFEKFQHIRTPQLQNWGRGLKGCSRGGGNKIWRKPKVLPIKRYYLSDNKYLSKVGISSIDSEVSRIPSGHGPHLQTLHSRRRWWWPVSRPHRGGCRRCRGPARSNACSPDDKKEPAGHNHTGNMDGLLTEAKKNAAPSNLLIIILHVKSFN